MLNKIINWFKGIHKKKEVFTQSILIVKENLIQANEKTTATYLNDPNFPNLIKNEPEVTSSKLEIRSIGEAGGGHSLGSLQQQAYSLKIMVNDALNYMCEKSPKPIKNWTTVSSLTLMPRAGKDINAYYDRTSLKFFYFPDPVTKKIIYACDARPVVTHEFGHAFLDILRPDWWDAQSIEIWAFHEAFGDMIATLNALRYDDLIDQAIYETNGDLLKSNILTRLANQMGAGLYHITNGSNGELPNCLRDLTDCFTYVTPEKIPSEGRYDQLLSEPHSFSRVFTGAFWEIVVRIANEQEASEKVNLKEAIKSSRDIVADYLLKATVNAPTTVRLFDAIARQIINIDQSQGGKYHNILFNVFNKRNIITKKILMLENVDFQSMIKNIKEPYEIQDHGKNKIIRTFGTKTLKLSDKLGSVSTLNNNPLIGLEITVPNQSAYYFNNGKLVDVDSDTEDEVVNTAYACLKILHEGNLVGNHQAALFKEQNGKLIRKQIICTCGRPNYCDPNAPEYRKPWKPANNSGCTSCHNKNCLPQSCDCNPSEPTPAPKLGCYTNLKAGNRNTYRVGSSASRRVC
jgi:hypothetical protein